MSEEETIKSFKSLMYNAKANWEYFNYEILFNFFSLYNNTIEENKKLNEYKENYIPIQKIKDKIETLEKIQKEFPNNERLEVKIIAYKELLEEGEYNNGE